ncbi:MAG: hypothetical protein ABI792_04030 [bacterium]
MVRQIKRSEILYLIILFSGFLLIALQFFGWIVDDLYIYFRYVNNFVNGMGIVYNPGEYVEGFSSFSWFMILSVFRFLGLPLELSAKLAGLLFVLPDLYLIYKISLGLGLGRLSIFVCILMMFNLPFIIWSVSGFEIMFYVFLLLAGFYKIIKSETSTQNSVTVSILIFFIAVSRPEGFLMAASYLVFLYIFCKDKKFAIKTAVLSGIMFSLFLIFRIIYFGDILPNTYYAKIGHDIVGNYELKSYRNGVFYIIDFFRHNIQFIPLLILIPFFIKNLIFRKSFKFIIAVICIQFFFTVFSGGDWMVQYRFIIPAVPFLSLALVFCLNEFIILKNIKAPGTYVLLSSFLLMIAYSIVAEDKFIIQKETVMWNNLKQYSDDIKKKYSARQSGCKRFLRDYSVLS